MSKKRILAARYDKTKISFAAFLAIAAEKIWLLHFVNMTRVVTTPTLGRVMSCLQVARLGHK